MKLDILKSFLKLTIIVSLTINLCLAADSDLVASQTPVVKSDAGASTADQPVKNPSSNDVQPLDVKPKEPQTSASKTPSDTKFEVPKATEPVPNVHETPLVREPNSDSPNSTAKPELAKSVVPEKQKPSVFASAEKLVAAKNCSSFSSTKPTLIKKTFPPVGNCVLIEFAAAIQKDNQYLALDDPEFENAKCTTNELVVDYGGCAGLTFTFNTKDNTTNYVSAITGYYVNGNSTTTNHFNLTGTLFPVKKQHYYKCKSEQQLHLGSDTSANTTLILSNFALELDRNSEKPEFVGTAEVCEMDSKPPGSDWVTLAVGVCLLALVAIVLVAYFVGRKRWYARSSYEPV